MAEGRLDRHMNVALEIQLNDGRRDLVILIDREDPLGKSNWSQDQAIWQRDWGLSLHGEIALIRCDRAGRVERAMVGWGQALRVNGLDLRWPQVTQVGEWRVS